MKLSVAFQNKTQYKNIFKIEAGGQVFLSEVIYLLFGAALLEMQKEVAELLLKPPGMSRTTYYRTAAQSSFVHSSPGIVTVITSHSSS